MHVCSRYDHLCGQYFFIRILMKVCMIGQFILRVHAIDNRVTSEDFNLIYSALQSTPQLKIERDSDIVMRVYVNHLDLANVIYTLTLYGINVYHIIAQTIY